MAFAAFAMFFVTVAPLQVVPVFATLTRSKSASERSRIALKAVMIASAVLTIFGVFGDDAVLEEDVAEHRHGDIAVFPRVMGIVLVALAAELLVHGLRDSLFLH